MQKTLCTLRALALGAALLLFAACGDDPDELVAGQPGDDQQSQETGQDESGDDPTGPTNTAAPGTSQGASEYVRVESRLDLVAATGGAIEELVIDADGTTLLVRYRNASEPCSGAHVTVAESDSIVEVTLTTGLDPNASAMTCITGVFPYEIAVPLTTPAGDRELIAVEPAPTVPAEDDPFEGAEFPTDQYLGLTEAEAMELGEIEQRVVRVARIDDEYFMLTQDFNPTRVNIEIEDGVVVMATSG